MDVSFETLRACLDISVDGDRAHAPTLGLDGGHLFGGQVLAQTVRLASSLQPEMPVRSMSTTFPRAMRDTGDVEFTVTPMHRGSAYAYQRIEVLQPDREGRPAVCATSQLLHHAPGPGIDHSATPPSDVGAPEDARRVELSLVPWDVRFVGTTDLDDRRVQTNRLSVWTRVDRRLDDDPSLHQALLAYLSELTLIGTALLQHDGWSQLDCHVALRTAVVTNHLFFHRPFRVDEWLLVDQTSPVASDGSAFGSGHVFDRSGRLVASVVQESMVRVDERRAGG